MRKRLLLCLMSICACNVSAQFLGIFQSSSNQQLINEAVSDCLFIVEQSYQLQDSTGHRYGRLGKEEFGKSFSCMIRIENGLCATSEAICPWFTDENFKKYEKSYTPVLFNTRYKEIGDTLMNIYNNFDSIPFVQVDGTSIYCFNDSLTNGTFQGLKCDSIVGKRDGWSVWVVSDRSMQEVDEKTNFSLTIYKTSIDIEEGKCIYDVAAPKTERNVYGGIMVMPLVVGKGIIAFKLVGVYSFNSNEDKWSLVRISNCKEEKSKKEELTPLN